MTAAPTTAVRSPTELIRGRSGVRRRRRPRARAHRRRRRRPRRPVLLLRRRHLAPAAVVLPGSVEEVQAIVGRRRRTTCRCGRSPGARTTATAAPARGSEGSVVVDLHRMDRVLEVNDETGYVVVEPGVTFLALAQHLRRHRLAAHAVGARHRLGQRDRQHPGARLRLHRPRRPLRFPVRHGGRARRRHRGPHRHGRPGRQRGLGPVQGRLRTLGRRAVLPVQPRHRHQDGRLAACPARDLHRLHAHHRSDDDLPRWSTRCDRCCSTAPCRATSSSATPPSSPRWSPPARTWWDGPGLLPDEAIDRITGAHGHRPLERPLRPLRARPSSSRPGSPSSRTPSRRAAGARLRVTTYPGDVDPADRAPRRPRPARHPQHRPDPDGRLARRHARAHRLLAGLPAHRRDAVRQMRADPRPGRSSTGSTTPAASPSTPATPSPSPWSASTATTTARPPTSPPSSPNSSPTPPPPATPPTAVTPPSWTSSPTSTTPTTPRYAGPSNASRTPSTRAASSPPASRASGPPAAVERAHTAPTALMRELG